MGEPEDIDLDAGEETAQPEEEQKTGFSIGKVIEWLLANMIPVIISVVLCTIISIIIVKSSVSKRGEEELQTAQISPKPMPLTIFPLGDFKVNTADIDETHFVRLTLSLGYNIENKKLQTELASRKTEMRDIVLGILNSKEKSDLDSDVEKDRLKDEIMKAINNVLRDGEVEAVYYDEFVIS